MLLGIHWNDNNCKYCVSKEFLELWSKEKIDYQVIPCRGNSQKGRHCLVVLYSNIVEINPKLFMKNFRTPGSKHIHTKKPPEKLFRRLQEP